MSKESLALRRIGEWAGLQGDQFKNFLSTVRPILSRALDERQQRQIGFDDLRDEYFDFLNEYVLSTDAVVDFLHSNNVDREVVERFEMGSVPIKATFREQSVVYYGLDEIVDFVMVLKLFKRYKELTGSDSIEPLEKFHSLVYLINHRLSEEDASHLIEDTRGFGMLWKTGYRYTFEKRDDYAWSESLQRDLDRLFAWRIIDRNVIEDPKPEWDLDYTISLGEAAELFLTRFETRLTEFDSVLLSEWERKQNNVLEDLANSSRTGISDHLRSIERFKRCRQENIVLNGRPKRFESHESTEQMKINA